MSSDSPEHVRPEGRIRLDRDGPVAWLTVDHQGKRNALSYEMWSALPGLIEQAQNDPDARVIALRGAGDKAFVSGSDISQFGERRNTPEGVAAYNRVVTAAVASVGQARLPTVAFVNGACFGGGVALAIHCDLRYALPGSTFSIPAGVLGIAYHPDWLIRLRDLVGPARAKRLLFTADRWDAEQALRGGLVDELVADADEAAARCGKIAGLAPLSLRAAKIAIDSGVSGLSAQHESDARAAYDACFASQDYVEGRLAFAEKRAPRFTGK